MEIRYHPASKRIVCPPLTGPSGFAYASVCLEGSRPSYRTRVIKRGGPGYPAGALFILNIIYT